MIELKCKICGSKFKVYKCRLKRNNVKYCSRKCKGVYQSYASKGKNNPHWKGGLAKVNCQKCGKSFKTIQRNLKKGIGKFCSVSCFAKTRKGINNSNWQGGKHIIKGYIYIYSPYHPYASKSGYVLEHHLIMENHLGRFILPNEIVHHINGNKQDNRIENLLLTTKSEHSKMHWSGICYKINIGRKKYFSNLYIDKKK